MVGFIVNSNIKAPMVLADYPCDCGSCDGTFGDYPREPLPSERVMLAEAFSRLLSLIP